MWPAACCSASQGFAWAAYAHSLLAALLAFGVAAMGYFAMMGPFWALPTRVLGGRAAAGGVAIITMIGSLGGFLGPYLTAPSNAGLANFTVGLLVIGALGALGRGALPGVAQSAAREPLESSKAV